MGALERDNGHCLDPKNNLNIYLRPDASPLAITCRQTPNIMLGGNVMFSKLITEAKENKVKIIIDSVARISSTRAHRRYKNLVPYILD